jgi:peptidoglycan-associated lipoprotein
MNDSMKKLVLLTSTITVLAACSTTPKVDSPAPVQKPVATTAPTPMSGIRAAPEPSAILDPLDDPKSGLANRSIYFDFNKYNVKGEFDSLNSTHANYLVSHTVRTIVIQGNTDSRGGREYNLALGQKRAESERKVLIALGVSDSRMEAVSFGKEKPKNNGENEVAWAENRRDDIVYSGN